ncbi:MAG: endolytic transglycosylase MltG [Eubacteriales bacterium]|nr:endolytic transglycosylase MltG [Eubacteriales bacterium]
MVVYSNKHGHAHRRWRLLIGPIFLIVIIIIILVVMFFQYIDRSSEPVDPNSTESITIIIPTGAGTAEISNILAEADLIQDSRVFRLQSKIEVYDGKYKAGEYTLSQSMSMEEIMRTLFEGKSLTVRFTIPEGYDIKRTTEKLAAEGLIDPEAFAEEIEKGHFDYKFVEKAPAGPNRLEGYLFPETYEIFTNANEHDIIDRMLYQFRKVFTEESYDRTEELGMTVNEVITLASIIEREARYPADRSVISSVFHNRLNIGMPLQSCATVQYILGEQKPVLSTKDTQIESPYNTYIINGLPPGPIGSPGEDSIRAALYPNDTNYLYFLAKGDGSHVFSETYDQFLRDKAKYIN